MTNRQNRILVLDGLENDDWAAYCALTYPDAIVYNLASSGKKGASAGNGNSESWVPPANLRKVYYSSIAAPFPFPKGFFTAVVFRFPIASAPHAYRNAISECKRTLRPGGFLELSILDMDMVNIGGRTRRAVREVKERMQLATPEVSLSPASDTMMKLLGRKGFENLNRCVVSVPITGAMSDSRAGLSDDSSLSGFSARPELAKTLTDLLAGAQETGSHFTGANMIARVGRWWWTRCYESGLMSDDTSIGSIWEDELLLKECETRETGLRLVVCYAQKPESVRRRTASV